MGWSSLPSKRAKPRRTTHPIQPAWVTEPLQNADVEHPERQSTEYRRLVTEVKTLAAGRCQARLSNKCDKYGTDPHHVYPCSEGGPVMVPPVWLRWVCRNCHAYLHSANGRPYAERAGLIIPYNRKANLP